jgi:anti-sigma regulatory factor (Ser/Thr protein kinase)
VSTGIDLRLSGGARAASAARHALDPLVHDLEPDLHENVRLLVSELVTNSIRHSGVRRRGSIELRVTVTDRLVRVEVCDPGPGFEARVAIPTVGQADGWGLFLVEQIADRWGVRGGDLTCVWFELKRRRRSPGRA